MITIDCGVRSFLGNGWDESPMNTTIRYYTYVSSNAYAYIKMQCFLSG